jgi:hypothetical protein
MGEEGKGPCPASAAAVRRSDSRSRRNRSRALRTIRADAAALLLHGFVPPHLFAENYLPLAHTEKVMRVFQVPEKGKKVVYPHPPYLFTHFFEPTFPSTRLR